MAKKSAQAGGSAYKKHQDDFTHMAVAFRDLAAIKRWVSSNFPPKESA